MLLRQIKNCHEVVPEWRERINGAHVAGCITGPSCSLRSSLREHDMYARLVGSAISDRGSVGDWGLRGAERYAMTSIGGLGSFGSMSRPFSSRALASSVAPGWGSSVSAGGSCRDW